MITRRTLLKSLAGLFGAGMSAKAVAGDLERLNAATARLDEMSAALAKDEAVIEEAKLIHGTGIDFDRYGEATYGLMYCDEGQTIATFHECSKEEYELRKFRPSKYV